MIVTDAELAGLAAICGDSGLPGLPCLASGVDQARMAFNGLMVKGLIGVDRCLTGPGKVMVCLVEEYCQATRHVFINRVKMSVNADGSVTVLWPVDGGWRVARLDSWAMLLSLVKGFRFLRSGGSAGGPGEWVPMSLGEWSVRRSGVTDAQVMVVREVDKHAGVSQTLAYDVVDGVGWVFDMAHRRARGVPGGVIRGWVAGLVGGDLDGVARRV